MAPFTDGSVLEEWNVGGDFIKRTGFGNAFINSWKFLNNFSFIGFPAKDGQKVE